MIRQQGSSSSGKKPPTSGTGKSARHGTVLRLRLRHARRGGPDTTQKRKEKNKRPQPDNNNDNNNNNNNNNNDNNNNNKYPY